jgi:hypothetical protein
VGLTAHVAPASWYHLTMPCILSCKQQESKSQHQFKYVRCNNSITNNIPHETMGEYKSATVLLLQLTFSSSSLCLTFNTRTNTVLTPTSFAKQVKGRSTTVPHLCRLCWQVQHNNHEATTLHSALFGYNCLAWPVAALKTQQQLCLPHRS